MTYTEHEQRMLDQRSGAEMDKRAKRLADKPTVSPRMHTLVAAFEQAVLQIGITGRIRSDDSRFMIYQQAFNDLMSAIAALEKARP